MEARKKIARIHSYKIQELKSAVQKRNDFGIFTLEEFENGIEHLKVPHRHDHFTIFFPTSGRGSHTIDFREYPLRKSRIFLLSPGQIHAWKFMERVKGYVLLFNREFFSVTNQSRDLRDFLFYNFRKERTYFDLHDKSAKRILGLLEQIASEYHNKTSFSDQIIRAHLNVLLFIMARLYLDAAPVNGNHTIPLNKIREFERAVNRSYKALRSVSEYASLLKVTPNYLNSICKKITGRQAGEIIRDRILLEAKRLLVNTNNSVAEIAYELNFEDNSYFGRFFKKYVKMTPLRFRQKNKENF